MNERMIVEVEVRARQAILEFEKLDNEFKKISGSNKRLQQELWRQYNAETKSAEKNTSALTSSLGKSEDDPTGTGYRSRCS